MLTIVLEVKCKSGLTSPNFASNVKNFLFHSITIHSILFHSISFYTISSHVSPFQPLSIHFFLFHFILFHSILLHFTLFHFILFHSLPFHTIYSISLCIIQPYETDRKKPNEFGQVKKYTDTYSVLLINYTKSTIVKRNMFRPPILHPKFAIVICLFVCLVPSEIKIKT